MVFCCGKYVNKQTTEQPTNERTKQISGCVCVCVYIYIYVCVCVCVCVCMCVCVYVSRFVTLRVVMIMDPLTFDVMWP